MLRTSRAMQVLAPAVLSRRPLCRYTQSEGAKEEEEGTGERGLGARAAVRSLGFHGSRLLNCRRLPCRKQEASLRMHRSMMKTSPSRT